MKNPNDRLSGDQNGNDPSSVPANASDVNESIDRTQIRVFPAAARAVNASFVPSGEIAALVAGRPPVEKVLPFGGLTKNRVTDGLLTAR